MSDSTRKPRPANPRSGEPGAGSDTDSREWKWPFSVPPEQRERVPAEPVREERPDSGQRPADPV